MNSGQATALAAKREFSEGFRSRAYRASTAIQIALAVGVAVISIVTSGDDATKFDVGSFGAGADVTKIATDEQGSFDAKLTVTGYPDRGAAEGAVRDGDVDAAVGQGELLTGSSPDTTLTALLQSAGSYVGSRDRLRASGVPDEQIDDALNPPPLKMQEVKASGEGGDGIAFIGALLLYIVLLGTGFNVASSIVVEKSSRVIELILSAIRPVSLLAGKIIGIGLLGLLQVLLTAGSGLAVALASGQVDLPESTAKAAVLVTLYFVLGFAFYACAFAASASLVSRQEDIQSATSPLLAVLIAGYIASITVANEPDGALATFCSLFPPTAPLVVPGRAAHDALPGWELAASLAIMVLGIAVMIRLAARIYENTVLKVGAPVRWRDALRAAR